MVNPLSVPGSLPWAFWQPPASIAADTQIDPPPSQLGTVLKNVITFTGIAGAIGGIAGALLIGSGIGGAVVPAALGANVGAILGVLEGMFLAGRDGKRYDAAVEEQNKKRKGRVAVLAPGAQPNKGSTKTRESWR